METEWGLFHDYHVKLSTQDCHLLFAPNLGCVSTKAWKPFPLGKEASVFLWTLPSPSGCPLCLLLGSWRWVCQSHFPPSLLCRFVCFTCVSFVSLLHTEWKPGCACLCLLPSEGKDSRATSFLHPNVLVTCLSLYQPWHRTCPMVVSTWHHRTWRYLEMESL